MFWVLHTLVGVNLDVAEGGIVVGRDDDVDTLNCSLEGLVERLFVHLELEKSAIDLKGLISKQEKNVI